MTVDMLMAGWLGRRTSMAVSTAGHGSTHNPRRLAQLHQHVAGALALVSQAGSSEAGELALVVTRWQHVAGVLALIVTGRQQCSWRAGSRHHRPAPAEQTTSPYPAAVQPPPWRAALYPDCACLLAVAGRINSRLKVEHVTLPCYSLLLCRMRCVSWRLGCICLNYCGLSGPRRQPRADHAQSTSGWLPARCASRHHSCFKQVGPWPPSVQQPTALRAHATQAAHARGAARLGRVSSAPLGYSATRGHRCRHSCPRTRRRTCCHTGHVHPLCGLQVSAGDNVCVPCF